MSAELSRRARPLAPGPAPDPAFAARPRLLRLRDALAAASRRPARWNEPAAFFFDARRQTELEAACPPAPDPFAALTDLIATEMPALLAHVEVRRVARALGGLRELAGAVAPRCAAANDLAELLAVPDDEVFLALAPHDRTGVRLHVRGAAEVGQLYQLLAAHRPGPFQLFAPAAVRPDGTLPAGFTGCGHWLWPTQPLAAVPRIGGARVVLVGPGVVRHATDGGPRFPALRVESELVQTLNPFQAAEALSQLTGRPVPVGPPAAEPLAAARAA
ncbi:MAG: hypothetical protein ACKODX_19710 [Gemmata sp.]